MHQIVFATHNAHKVIEMQALLEPQYKVLSLTDIGCLTDIPETGSTFQENALIKSSFVHQNYQIDCFADDSGLEVKALGQEPGVYSARYSGEKNDRVNLELVLERMQHHTDRRARFKTVIALVLNGENYFFEGVIKGHLSKQVQGHGGFGYDPIFIPEGYSQSFAEMDLSEKNRISHRARAVQQMLHFLQHKL